MAYLHIILDLIINVIQLNYRIKLGFCICDNIEIWRIKLRVDWTWAENAFPLAVFYVIRSYHERYPDCGANFIYCSDDCELL